jgi:RNA polymerase sigma-70 factor (ECF subfamily)
MDIHNDRDLFKRYKEGDEDALGVLVSRYAPPVYGFVLRLLRNADDARDVTQEAFIKAWKHRGRYDPSQEFRAWVFGIARHAALDVLRKRRSYSFADLEEEGEDSFADSVADPSPLPDELYESSRMMDALEYALGELPMSARTVILLKQEGLTFEEIGSTLGESVNTVKSRYRRGLITLRDILHQNGAM